MSCQIFSSRAFFSLTIRIAWSIGGGGGGGGGGRGGREDKEINARKELRLKSMTVFWVVRVDINFIISAEKRSYHRKEDRCCRVTFVGLDIWR